MVKCFFCEKIAQPGKGVLFVTMEGKVIYFCSSKCRKHLKLNRSRKQSWVTKGVAGIETARLDKERKEKSEKKAAEKK
jgi:large subunit ribosomal protein L24e